MGAVAFGRIGAVRIDPDPAVRNDVRGLQQLVALGRSRSSSDADTADEQRQRVNLAQHRYLLPHENGPHLNR